MGSPLQSLNQISSGRLFFFCKCTKGNTDFKNPLVPKFWPWFFSLLFSWFAKLALLHMAQKFKIYNPLQNPGEAISTPYIQNYKNASIFKISENGTGPSFPTVFLNPSSKHSHYHNISLAEDRCAHHIRPRRPPSDHLLHRGVRGWGGPIPHGRDCQISEIVKVQEKRQKKQVKYSCFFSTCSLHIVVENAGIHLSISRWWHELELGSIHKNRAVLGTINVI